MTYEQTDPLTAAYARIKALEAEVAALKKQVPKLVWRGNDLIIEFGPFSHWIGSMVRRGGVFAALGDMSQYNTTKDAAEAHVRKLLEIEG